MKYIIYNDGNFEVPVIFPEFENHSDVGRRFSKVISAGFCDCGIGQDGQTRWGCWGRSESLNLSGRGDIDSEILNRTLR